MNDLSRDAAEKKRSKEMFHRIMVRLAPLNQLRGKLHQTMTNILILQDGELVPKITPRHQELLEKMDELQSLIIANVEREFANRELA